MLRVKNLSLRAGDFRLEDVCLHVQPREYFVLMGPTGSGKSLFVKCVCGLVRPIGGSVHLGPEEMDITSLAPRDRRIGYVPQDCGLFPHMSVAKNVTFSLRVRGVSAGEALRRADHLIETLDLEPLLDRMPVNLSGGERQKVAVARALAGDPTLLVLDEPVSSLDEPTRREVCRELRRVQRRLGVPTIHVCHSVVEAQAVSDRVGVFCAGRLLHVGTVEEFLRNPPDETVGRLFGTDEPPGQAGHQGPPPPA